MYLKKTVVLGTIALLAATLPAVGYAASEMSKVTSASDYTTVAQVSEVAIASGTFVAAEQPTTGMARIVEEGGHRYLELDAAFTTSSQGPDLHVLLDTTNTPPGTYADQGRTINLGGLKEYSGAQRYPIPDAIDVSNYQSVVIWCRMANATFGYAPLHTTERASIQQ